MKLNSLEQLRKVAGLKPLRKRKDKPVLCRKCGAEMTKVGENVWFCEADAKDKNGKVIYVNGAPKSCGNTYIRHSFAK